jgi:hypothetical protein
MQREMVNFILALTMLAHTTGNVQVYKLVMSLPSFFLFSSHCCD